MTEQDLFTLVRCQVLQVTATIVLVWLLVQLFARKRPHLATALWMVVLLKCLTPPILTSPVALFAMLPSIDFEEPEPAETISITPVEPIEVSEAYHLEPVEIDPLSRGYEIEWDDSLFTAEEIQAEPIPAEITHAPPPAVQAEPKFPPLWKWWLISAGTALCLIFLRVLFVLRGVRKQQTETPCEILELVESLRQRLKIRRSIRVCVTLRKVGPAVIGLFRPTIILPQAVIEGRSAAELEPIIAHELLHIRRGDLGVGWLRLFAQALWWFHPLVWLVNQCLSRETERCCDEAVLAELRCSPAHYARCLLHVLEQKRNLSPIPAFPGVKPVEITKRRMERIMQLGQGSRKRTPLWCWLVVLLLGAVVLPGNAISQSDLQKTENKEVAAPLTYSGTRDAKLAQTPQLAPLKSNDAQRQITKTYQIGKLLTRLETDYKLEPEIAPLILTNLVRISLLNVTGNTIGLQPVQNTTPKLVLSGDQLTISATNKYHAAAKKCLATWTEHGLYEVKLEVRFATHSEKLELPESLAKLKEDRGSETLDEKQMFELINLLQGDSRSNILYAPKVTMSHGTQAEILDLVQRPFVTAYENDKPKIVIMEEGWRISLSPVVTEEEIVKLDSTISFSNITGVTTQELEQKVDGKPVSIQLPEIEAQQMNVSGVIPAGKSLAIRGPSRQIEGRKVLGRGVWDNLSDQFQELLGTSIWQEKLDPQVEQMLILITPKAKKLERDNLLALGIDPIDVLNADRKKLRDAKNTKDGLMFDGGKIQKQSVKVVNLDESDKTAYRKEIDVAITHLQIDFSVTNPELSLKEILTKLQQQAEIPLLLDQEALLKIGQRLNDSTEIYATGVSALTILNRVIEPLGYALVPVDNPETGLTEPVLLITSKTEAERLSLVLFSQNVAVFPTVVKSVQIREAEQMLEARLDREISVDFEGVSLSEGMKRIANAAGLTIYLAQSTFPDAIKNSSKVLLKHSIEGNTARKILKSICQPVDLVFSVEDEVIKISGREYYENEVIAKYYPILDQIEIDKSGQPTEKPLLRSMSQKIDSHTWGWQPEPKLIYRDSSPYLLVRGSRKLHAKIADFLQDRRVQTSPSGSGEADEADENHLSHNSKPQAPKIKIPQGSVQFKFDLPKNCQLDIPQANVPYELEDVRMNLEPRGEHTSYLTRSTSSSDTQVGTTKPAIIYNELYSLVLQVHEVTPTTREHLDHNAVPIKVMQEDLDQLAAHNRVSKVYYLADGQADPVKSQLEVLVSTRLDPSVDPVAEADRRGTVVAVMRLKQTVEDLGTGVNSDSGVTGVITIDEKSFETEKPKDQPETWDPKTKLSGRILDHQGKPLAGARVMLIGNQNLEIKAGQWEDYLRPGGFQSIARPSVFTDEEGRFELTGPVSPTNRLAIMHDSYRLHVVSANEVRDERSLSIKLPQPSSLVVRVGELRPEELSDIVIRGTGAYRTHFYKNKFALALTDFQKQQDGSFLISGLPQGAYYCRDQKNVRWIPSARNDSEVKRIAVAPALSSEFRPGQRMNLAQTKKFMKQKLQPSPIATYRAEEYRSIQIDKPGSKLTLDLNAKGNRRAIPGRILGLENPTKNRLFVMVEANASVLRRQLPGSVHWTGLSIHHTSRASADGKIVFQEIANGDYEFTVVTRSIKDGPPESKAYRFPALSIDSATKEIVLDIRKATPSSERSITRPGALIPPAAAPNHLASDQPTIKGSEQRKKTTGKLQTVVYPVADLVVPIVQENNQSKRFKQIPGTNTGVPITDTPIGLPGPPHLPRPAPPVDGPGPGVILPRPVHNPLGAPAGLKSHTIRDVTQRNSKHNASPLIELIEQTLVEAKMPLREQSKIVFSESTLSLVIRAKSTQHDVIQQLLATLRREQDIQVTLECLTVRFDKNSFRDYWTNPGIDFVADPVPRNTILPLVLYGVNADDFRSKIDKFKPAHVLSAPKVTVFNGVGAEIQIGAQVQIADGKMVRAKSTNSMHYLLIPTVSENRHKVEVKFAINPESILDAVSKSKSFTVSDGISILFEVTDDLIAEDRKGTVPGVSQAVREMKKKQLGERTFVLLTPRIIVQEEEEEKTLMETPRGVIGEEEEPLLDNLNDVPLNRIRKR